MKTTELIAALAADKHSERNPRWRLAMGMLAGSALATVLFFIVLGVRSDLAAALGTWRFEMKMAVLVLAVALGAAECMRASTPIATRPGAAILLVPIVLLAMVAMELASVQAFLWSDRVVGANARVCLAVIPALAIAPLVAMLVALRSAAPASPTMAGALAGLTASAIAGTLYGLYCFNDSPLFVATWYPLAAAFVTGLGAIAGSRMLRW